MYAVVDIAGQQFKIEKDNKLLINRIKGEVGSKVSFSKVLFIDNAGKVKIGNPYVKDASVTAKILSHIKGNKIKVFKKKKRKGYKVLNGYRHYLTEILIENISEVKIASKVTAKEKTAEETAEKKAEVTVKTTDKKTEKKAEKKAVSTKPESKPTTAKREAIRKADVKPAQVKKQASVKKEDSPKKTVTKKATAVKSQTGQSKTVKKTAAAKIVGSKKSTVKSKSEASKKATNKEPGKTSK